MPAWKRQKNSSPHPPFERFSETANAPGSVLLYSGGDSEAERNFFWASAPRAVLTVRGNDFQIQEQSTLRSRPFSVAALDEELETFGLWKNPTTYAIGYFAYELGRNLMPPMPGAQCFRTEPLGHLPDLWLGIYDDVHTGVVTKGAVYPRPVSAGHDVQSFSDCTAAEFRQNVERVLHYIRQGDLYQANLAQCFTVPWTPKRSPYALFEELSRTNAAPFSAYLRLNAQQAIVSCSPERFLRLRQGRLRAEPIKGTAARGSDEASDAQASIELLRSAKNRAELTMIVDLLRNDLGRICQPGSIHVPALAAARTFASVHHLVGIVEGTLQTDISPGELLRATFPGGSITGAPKGRATQVICELETKPRGVYCGAIGYFGPQRTMDLNIAIRTLQIDGNRAMLHAGAGIVAESQPQAEYEETLAKVAPILEAILADENLRSAPARLTRSLLPGQISDSRST